MISLYSLLINLVFVSLDVSSAEIYISIYLYAMSTHFIVLIISAAHSDFYRLSSFIVYVNC